MIKARQFYLTLTEVLKCASKDNTLPAIWAVKVVVKNGDMFLMSTDRYRIAVGKIENTGLNDGEWVIARDIAAEILAAMKAFKIGTGKTDGTELTIETGDTWTIRGERGSEIHARADWEADFPNIAKHLPDYWESGVTLAGDKIGADKNYSYSFNDDYKHKAQIFASSPNFEADIVGVVMPINVLERGRIPWNVSKERKSELAGA